MGTVMPDVGAPLGGSLEGARTGVAIRAIPVGAPAHLHYPLAIVATKLEQEAGEIRMCGVEVIAVAIVEDDALAGVVEDKVIGSGDKAEAPGAVRICAGVVRRFGDQRGIVAHGGIGQLLSLLHSAQ